MCVVRKLEERDIPAFTRITSLAYTGLGYSNEDQERLAQWAKSSISEWEHQDLYGVFEGEDLIGCMCLFVFNMNVRSTIVKAGGIGTVAVGLLHKKQKAAKELIGYALRHFRNIGVSMVTLYPFEVGFYQRMGFGYGCELRQFRVKPSAFPDFGERTHLQILTGTSEVRREALEIYNRWYMQTHGMTQQLDPSMSATFKSQNRVIGYRENGKLEGYMVISFESKNAFHNDLVVKDWAYTHPRVLREFSTFLQAQADQFDRIVLNTQDEALLHLLRHPGNGFESAFKSINIETSTTAVGMMYRAVDLSRLFQSVQKGFGRTVPVTVRICLSDDFLPEAAGEHIVRFEDGRATVLTKEEGTDVELRIGVSSISSLLMGSVDLHGLLRYGLATLSDIAFMDVLTTVFRTTQKPVCTLRF